MHAIDTKNDGWPDWSNNCCEFKRLKLPFSRLDSDLRFQYIKVGLISRKIDTYWTLTIRREIVCFSREIVKVQKCRNFGAKT